jgi:hypothetical protein
MLWSTHYVLGTVGIAVDKTGKNFPTLMGVVSYWRDIYK